MRTSRPLLSLVTALSAVVARVCVAADGTPVTLAEKGIARAVIVVPSSKSSRLLGGFAIFPRFSAVVFKRRICCS
jgi:hypothetical protein